MVGLHRGKFVAPQSKAWMVDGDGEGWTPPLFDQSILILRTIYYRPLASDELNTSSHSESLSPALQGECVQGLARLASFCKAIADSVRSTMGNVSAPTNDQHTGP
jgi:hypothetical protein